MTIYDISPRISERLAVWPGDTPPCREVLLEMSRGDNVNLTTLRATVHLGAHADAPLHFIADGPDIAAADLDVYLGPCEVIGVQARPGQVIGPGDLPRRPTAPRVLIRTGTYPDFGRFGTNFASLAPELIAELAGAGCRLIGVDTPSVDPFDSVDLPAHHACCAHGMAILEVLDLAGVPNGTYELIALPLRLEGFDASPVRAVLRGYGP